MIFTAVFVLLLTTSYAQDDSRITELENVVNNLARQVMLQQLFVEERIRSDGSSGIKQIRHNKGGTRPYYYESHTLNSVCSIHDHANNIRTLGMGEFVGVLNGVEFRTRHNDYGLRKPSTTSTEYHAVEDIEYPDVPPSVLEKTTVAEQIAEMREYFRAFNLQRPTIRDFKPYFKPVLCYLEGVWTTETESLDEPFDSDRHHLDANSWFDLQEKIRFTSMTGLKDVNENYAFLPTTIINVTDGTPHYAQWNYRVLCHPMKRNLWLNRLKPVDDLAARLSKQLTMEEFTLTRAARYRMNGPNKKYEEESAYQSGFLDDIMYGIPGMDNYASGSIKETAFGIDAFRVGKTSRLNAGHYHRLFRAKYAGAMGVKTRHRSYSDEYLYVALNTQPKVAPVSLTDCKKVNRKSVCNEYTSRVSYAIPLEIVFMTPLLRWNPHNIIYKGDAKSDIAKTVEADGRNGELVENKAWDGTHSKLFYQTPAEFFQGSEVGVDPADTTKGAAGVLDKDGVMRTVVASGTRILLPEIQNVGVVRTRYPIMPIHAEGGAVWKEVDALKEIVMNLNTYNSLLHEQLNMVIGKDTTIGTTHLRVATTTQSPPGNHHHEIYVLTADLAKVTDSTTVKAYTSKSLDHEHELEIRFNSALSKFVIASCDGMAECWDGHSNVLEVIVL